MAQTHTSPEGCDAYSVTELGVFPWTGYLCGALSPNKKTLASPLTRSVTLDKALNLSGFQFLQLGKGNGGPRSAAP